jgi:hypothetical protein
MKTLLLTALFLTNAIWFVSYRREVKSLNTRSEILYYENYANDHAATECAAKTGFRYNCADGTQQISCGGAQ